MFELGFVTLCVSLCRCLCICMIVCFIVMDNANRAIDTQTKDRLRSYILFGGLWSVNHVPLSFNAQIILPLFRAIMWRKMFSEQNAKAKKNTQNSLNPAVPYATIIINAFAGSSI